MIVKWGDILDSRANYSYVAQVNICKTSEFFKYNITYPVLKLYDKYVKNYNFPQWLSDILGKDSI